MLTADADLGKNRLWRSPRRKKARSQELDAFRSKGGKEALLLDGARQVGKTYIVRRYAERYYKNYVEINFIKNEAAQKLFEGIWNEKEFFWLAKAGIALPVYNVDLPRIPLELARKSNLFKLFMNDVGLLAAQYMDGIQLEILNGNLDVNFGAVFENFVAEELTAQ